MGGDLGYLVRKANSETREMAGTYKMGWMEMKVKPLLTHSMFVALLHLSPNAKISPNACSSRMTTGIIRSRTVPSLFRSTDA